MAVLLAIGFAGNATAHAVLLEADPPDGGILAHAPAYIRLHFNEAVTPVSIRLIGPDGNAVALNDQPKAVDQDVTVKLPEGLGQGGYIVSYRVISLDTHPVGGSLSFLIGSSSATLPNAPVGTAAEWETAFPFMHGAMLIALMLVVGGGLFHAFVDDRLPRQPYVPVAGAIASVAAILAVGIRGSGLAETTLPDFFSSAPWRVGLSTAMGPALVLILSGILSSTVGYVAPQRWLSRLAVIAGVIAASVGLALVSHAALAQPMWIAFPAFVVHVAVAAFWFGSLPLLIIALANGRLASATVVRFSSIAIWGVAALLVAGVILTAAQTGPDIGVWAGPAWTEGPYGPVLLAKLLAVAAILALAVYHKRQLTPRLTTGDSHAAIELSRSIRHEASIMVLVLALAASLGSFEPPRSIAAMASMEGHDAGGTALYVVRQGYGILLEMSPAKTGANEITVRFSDPSRNGVRVKPMEVVIGLALPSAGIEPLERRAKPVDDGAYRVELMPVPTSGVWQVRIDALIDDFDKVLATVDVPIDAAR